MLARQCSLFSVRAPRTGCADDHPHHHDPLIRHGRGLRLSGAAV